MITLCMRTKDIEAEAGITEINGHALQECCVIIGMVDIFNILDVITPFFRSLFVIRHGLYYIILSCFFQADGSWVNSFIRRELGAACRTALRGRVGWVFYFWFIRKNVERGIRHTGFPLLSASILVKDCGNNKQKQSVRIVILGFDPGIQAVFIVNMKNTYFQITALIYNHHLNYL